MSNTEWASITGYEGLYEVSSDGRVRTLAHKTMGHSIPSKELAITIHKSQRYAKVRLYKDGRPKDHAVHRLVATAFVPNPEGKPQINHKDGNKANNSATNLEWCTQAENNNHAIRKGLNSTESAVKATMKKVVQLNANGESVKVWDSMTEAAIALGLQVSNISHCCKGRIKSTGGYRWEFLSDRSKRKK